ncbi:hypothetical protein B0H14DRAFT_2934781 [Mycena olivaceomarginata]|nr:hypothetical protein B0H14DRAFT_2934781 [Mycena olivaceomarginata]
MCGANFYLTFSFPYFPRRRRIMDIHIILNPGAVGTPSKSNAQSNKKQPQEPQTPRRGSRTPTSVDSSPGPAIHRRSSGRTKTPSTRATPLRSYATPTPTPTRRSRPRQAPPSPRLESSVESTATTASGAPSRANILAAVAPGTALALYDGRRNGSQEARRASWSNYASYLGRDYYDFRRDNNGEYGFHANDNNTSDSDSDWSEERDAVPYVDGALHCSLEGDCL